MYMKIDSDIAKLRDQVISHRRWLHQYPQIGYQEEKARDYIINFLKDLNFDEIKIMARTGIKALIKGKEEGKTLAFRADMDALSITEETELEYASKHKGFMHACGHDGHMAMLLGFAQWLSENKDNLSYNVVLLFQPSEETVGGALPMIEEGALQNPDVDCIFGYHIMPEVPQGKIGLLSGPLMASTTEFTIDLTGISAHGAMPHKGVDAILAAAHYITQMQSILTRRIDPFQQAVVTIGKFQGGEARNILASNVRMEGTIRTFDEGTAFLINKYMKDLLKGMETSHGIRGELKELVYYPPVINHQELADKVKKIVPQEMLHPINPMTIAEDFSYFQQQVPGLFIFLGSRNEEKNHTHPLHSNQFQFDEELLLTGIQLYKNIMKNKEVI